MELRGPTEAKLNKANPVTPEQIKDFYEFFFMPQRRPARRWAEMIGFGETIARSIRTPGTCDRFLDDSGHVSFRRVPRICRDYISFPKNPRPIHITEFPTIRLRLGITQRELAAAADIAPITISRLENYNPGRGKLKFIYNPRTEMIKPWIMRVLRDVYMHGDEPFPYDDDLPDPLLATDKDFTLKMPPPIEPRD